MMRDEMLELAILGLLKEQELHGYELKKRLVDSLGFASGVSFGSLYPALTRLETAGAVQAVESRVAVAVPHTGSLNGEMAAFRARKPAGTRGSRGKKVYGITERGELLFEELLAAGTQSSDDDRIFNLRLAFARYLPPMRVSGCSSGGGHTWSSGSSSCGPGFMRPGTATPAAWSSTTGRRPSTT